MYRMRIVLLALTTLGQRVAVPQADSIPVGQVCSSADASFVAPCFTVQARLTRGADNILVRVWPVGTTRLLGWTDETLCSLPPPIDSLIAAGKTVYADVVVRPLTPSRPGYMQFVCINAATKVVVRANPP